MELSETTTDNPSTDIKTDNPTDSIQTISGHSKVRIDDLHL